jgi:predicted nuclease with RNAse H fold
MFSAVIEGATLVMHTLGQVTFDTNGHVQTLALPAERYRVLSDAQVRNKRVMGNQPVDVSGADAPLELHRRNSMLVE